MSSCKQLYATYADSLRTYEAAVREAEQCQADQVAFQEASAQAEACRVAQEQYLRDRALYEESVRAAESCTAEQSAYQARLAAAERAKISRDACSADFAKYDALAQEALACKLQLTAWETDVSAYKAARAAYEKEKQRVEAHNAQVTADNIATRAVWTKQVNAITLENEKKKAAFEAAKLAWQNRNAKYLIYKAQIQKLKAQVDAQWAATQAKYPHLKAYSYPVFIGPDGTSFPCLTKASHEKLAGSCLVLRGLGGLPAASDCSKTYMPTCPTMPAPVPAPGPYPVEPTYTAIPALVVRSDVQRLPVFNAPKDPGTRPTCSPTTPARPVCDPTATAPEPGNPPGCSVPGTPPVRPTDPSCNPNAGNPPGCSVPNYPISRPVAPPCDPNASMGTGGLLLLALVAGGGLYYLARRK